MIVTITTTHEPATDLGYLLHKHPDRLQAFEVSMGTAYVCYPEATDRRCTAALILEVDPIGLVRGKSGHRRPEAFSLGAVRERPTVRCLVDDVRGTEQDLPHRDDRALRRPA